MIQCTRRFKFGHFLAYITYQLIRRLDRTFGLSQHIPNVESATAKTGMNALIYAAKVHSFAVETRGF